VHGRSELDVVYSLPLARPHIIATLAESNVIRGPAFITVVMTLVAVLCSVLTVWFTMQFFVDLTA